MSHGRPGKMSTMPPMGYEKEPFLVNLSSHSFLLAPFVGKEIWEMEGDVGCDENG